MSSSYFTAVYSLNIAYLGVPLLNESGVRSIIPLGCWQAHVASFPSTCGHLWLPGLGVEGSVLVSVPSESGNVVWRQTTVNNKTTILSDMSIREFFFARGATHL